MTVRYNATSGTPRYRPEHDTVADALRCDTDGCGDARTGLRTPDGWISVLVVGSGDPVRRYCSGHCAARGIAHVELGHHRMEASA